MNLLKWVFIIFAITLFANGQIFFSIIVLLAGVAIAFMGDASEEKEKELSRNERVEDIQLAVVSAIEKTKVVANKEIEKVDDNHGALRASVMNLNLENIDDNKNQKFDIILKSAGANRQILLIKELQIIRNMSLKEAMNLVNSGGKIIEGIDKAGAVKARDRLESVGAEVELLYCSSLE